MRTLRRIVHKWEDNIKIDLGEIECESMEWIHLAEDRVHW
jgi:hypothetical protein